MTAEPMDLVLDPAGHGVGQRSPGYATVDPPARLAVARLAVAINRVLQTHPDRQAWGVVELGMAIEEYLGAVGDLRVAVEGVCRIRRAVLAGGRATPARVDDVLDAVLQRVVDVALAELQAQALTDPLTGLGNRRALERDLPAELARAGRSATPLGLVLADVDGLKAINDLSGHAEGDAALRRMAAALRRVGRGSDRAYRLGGDEFVLLLPGGAVTDAADLTKRLARSGAPSFSLGIADSAADPADQLLTVADQRMYASRSDGRHRRPSRSATPSKT